MPSSFYLELHCTLEKLDRFFLLALLRVDDPQSLDCIRYPSGIRIKATVFVDLFCLLKMFDCLVKYTHVFQKDPDVMNSIGGSRMVWAIYAPFGLQDGLINFHSGCLPTQAAVRLPKSLF